MDIDDRSPATSVTGGRAFVIRSAGGPMPRNPLTNGHHGIN
jgi:hypothetical protein